MLASLVAAAVPVGAEVLVVDGDFSSIIFPFLQRDAIGIARQHRAIVSWPDPDGSQLRAISAAGIRASGRAGRLRAAFHLWNTLDDVERVARALR